MKLRVTQLLVCNLLTVVSIFAQEVIPTDEIAIHVVNGNISIQSNLDHLVGLVIGVEKGTVSEREVKESFDLLKGSSSEDEKELLMYMLAYKGELESVDSVKGRAIRVLIGALYPLIPTDELTPYAVACMEDTQDPILIRNIEEVLDGLVFKTSNKPDYSIFSCILERKTPPPPSSLIRYMFDRSPKEAVKEMCKINGLIGSNDESNDLADICINGDDMECYADRSGWWAHLYVATMMEKYPDLRSIELLEKLEEDSNPLVQEKVNAIKQKMQQAEEKE